MSIRVLVVDDSKFICNRISEILEQDSEFEVIGFAFNGQEAVEKAEQLTPDVITMDVEMPVMDGISAVKKIMQQSPTAILMFSSATHVGAKATLDALNAGAVDFLPKQLDEIDEDKEKAKHILRRRVRFVARHFVRQGQQKSKTDNSQATKSTVASTSTPFSNHNLSPSQLGKTSPKIGMLLLVASTGGPVAIQKLMMSISAYCRFPVLIVQHMPKTFTFSFAERLNQICALPVKEAAQGDFVVPGTVLLAPGGMQTEVVRKNDQLIVNLREKASEDIFSPCADITLKSIAKLTLNNIWVMILTGMGTDGRHGAAELKKQGQMIWAQDEESSTIYGMPKAVAEAKLADRILSLDDIAMELSRLSA